MFGSERRNGKDKSRVNFCTSLANARQPRPEKLTEIMMLMSRDTPAHCWTLVAYGYLLARTEYRLLLTSLAN